MSKNYYANVIMHHGILGQKWGIRRFQYKDGSLTPAGKERYDESDAKTSIKTKKPVDNSNTQKKNEEDQHKKMLKRMAIGAAIGLGIGAGAYLIYKTRQDALINNDITIPAGEVLQRISPASETELHDVFYAAFEKKDKQRYEGLLPAHYAQRGNSQVVKKIINSNKDLKIAGKKECEQIFNKVYGKGTYDSFNQYVVARNDPSVKKIYDDFFNELKEKGYSGFLDINDQKYSGYGAKHPVVLFKDEAMSIVKSEKISHDPKKYTKEVVDMYKEALVKGVVASPLTIVGATFIGSKVGKKTAIGKKKGV